MEPGTLRVSANWGDVAIISRPGPKLGLIDRDGRVIVEPSFERLDGCAEGLCVARAGGKDGYIDYAGHWVIEPRFWRANPFHGPLATVEEPVDKETNEIAYIDRKGNVVYHMRFTGFINPRWHGQ